MKILLRKTAYETLIKQVIFVEENIDEMLDIVINSGRFSSKEKANQFFQDYINKIESLFEEIQIIDDKKPQLKSNVNLLPFIILDCHFTLRDNQGGRYFCHLSNDNEWDRKNPNIQLYFLTETGLGLIGKDNGDTVRVDIGMGLVEYTISSIRII
ncbi:MAG: hypothetical protein ACOX8Q_04680 [Christensenellales bacterium]|jgi:hypothetical protein